MKSQVRLTSVVIESEDLIEVEEFEELLIELLAEYIVNREQTGSEAKLDSSTCKEGKQANESGTLREIF